MARLVFGMNQSLDGYVDHMSFGPSPALFRHFIKEAQEQAPEPMKGQAGRQGEWGHRRSNTHVERARGGASRAHKPNAHEAHRSYKGHPTKHHPSTKIRRLAQIGRGARGEGEVSELRHRLHTPADCE